MSRNKVQPDETTSLLRDGENDRYEALTGGAGRPTDIEAGDTEHDALLSPADSDSNSAHDGTATSASSAADATQPRSYLVNTNPARFRVVFGGIMLTYFMASVDGTILASSHPVITSHFRASNMASWLTTAFMLAATAFQPFVGRLSDALGRKPLYLATVGLFAVATLWCALAGSIASFIAARAFCGLGAGGMMTLGAISISDLVPIEYVGFFNFLLLWGVLVSGLISVWLGRFLERNE